MVSKPKKQRDTHLQKHYFGTSLAVLIKNTTTRINFLFIVNNVYLRDKDTMWLYMPLGALVDCE